MKELDLSFHLLLLIAPILAAIVSFVLARIEKPFVFAATALVPAFLAFTCLTMLPAPGQAITESWPWVESLGVAFSFYFDGLSALFALVILSVGVLITVYAAYYMSKGRGRLVGLVHLFMAAMLGVVTADNAITLFMFWELTGVVSYFLISFNGSDKALKAARKAFLITAGGGLVMLVGLVMAAVATGTLSISALSGAELQSHPWYPVIIISVFFGAFTKSAQFPFSGWLPSAMEAPTPASAYLHSATMVKAGIYLLARFEPVLGNTLAWSLTLVAVGGVTTVLSAYQGLFKRDMKQLLAYSTISILGMLVVLIGLGGAKAITAMVILIVAHASYKASLFMVAGTVDKMAGTRIIDRLGSLFQKNPLLGSGALVAALSMIGLPPLLGFIAKELVLVSSLATGYAMATTVTLVAASAFMVAIALLVVARPFFLGAKDGAQVAGVKKTSPVLSWLPFLLASLGLVFGLFPRLLQQLSDFTVASIIPGAVAKPLALWPEINTKTLLALAGSVTAIVLGLLLFRKLRNHEPVEKPGSIDFTPALARAKQLIGLFVPGHMRRQLLVIFAVSALALAWPLLKSLLAGIEIIPVSMNFVDIVLMVATAIGAIMVAFSRQHMSAIVALGLVGVAIALIFARLNAPDLALTLVMVEAVTVLFFVLLFHRLPRLTRRSNKAEKAADILVATIMGLVVTGLTLASAALHLPPEVAEQYGARALLEAYGRNVVNVILVDFRALDTLGEVIVVAVAALGAYALLRTSKNPVEKKDPMKEADE